jgi:hypothetical protein
MTVTEVLSIEDMQEHLEDVILRPFGQEQTFHFTIEEDEDNVNFLLLTLTNNFAWDSRTFDFAVEDFCGSMLDMHSQTFTRSFYRHSKLTLQDLDMEVVHLTAYAFAHESLEWLRRWEGNDAVLIYDPHSDDGDVQVVI